MPSVPPETRLRFAARQLLSPALLAYGISGAAAVASFGSTLLLARTGGAAIVGHYALAISTANLLATLGALGLDRVLLRQIAGDLQEGIPGRARATLTTILLLVGLFSFALAVAYLVATWLGPVAQALGADQGAMLAATIGVLIWPLFRLAYSGLRGAGMPIIGQFFEALPTFLFALAILLLWLSTVILSSGQVTVVFLLAQLLATIGAGFLLWKKARTWGDPVEVEWSSLLLAGLPILGIGFMQISAEWVLLARISATATPAEVGAFRVAFQVMTIAMVVVATGESYVSPKIAADFRAGRLDLMWKRQRRATVLMFALAGPFLLLSLLVPEELLGIAFGPEFVIAATPLSIMAVAQLVAVARGPVGAMMIMAGLERQQLMLTIVGLALLLLLSFTLIPRFGLVGAAIAYAAPIILRSVGGYLIARRILPDKPPA